MNMTRRIRIMNSGNPFPSIWMERTALVMESAAKDGKYVFLGLTDREKDRELFYMMEQDSMIGRYIGARELFEAEMARRRL